MVLAPPIRRSGLDDEEVAASVADDFYRRAGGDHLALGDDVLPGGDCVLGHHLLQHVESIKLYYSNFYPFIS